ncbi:MAG: hypothetical protein V4577_13510, partial [Bacteroidota bacterium]
MKIPNASTLTLLLMLTCLVARSQTTDRITYDIIYDVSGSVPINDTHGNIRALLRQVLQISGKDTINSYADFHIYFIGGDFSKVLGSNSYLSVNSNDLKKSKSLVDDIEKQIAGSRKQKYTYLHTALDEIWKANNTKIAQKDKVAGGVFIFTDGQIGENDFEQNDQIEMLRDKPHYLKAVNQKIGLIEQALHKPVFIIQSYLLPQNDYAIIPDSSKFPNVNKDFYVTPNWFWVKSTSIADTSKKIRAAFENFIDQANITIVNSNKLIPQNDTIAASIKLEQIFNLAKAAGPGKLTAIVDKAFAGLSPADFKGAAPSSLKNALAVIVRIAGASSFVQADVVDLQKSVKTLAQFPEIIRTLQTNIATDIGTQVTLTSDQALTAATLPAVKTDVQVLKASTSESIQTMILNGIAKYLVDRVKEEVALYFIDEVNKQSLNAKYKYREIGMFLLPNTKQIVRNPANYTDINALKTAFLKDIDQLPDNLAKHADLFGKSEGLVALKYFYTLYSNIRQTNSLEISFEGLGKTIEQNIRQQNPSKVNSGTSDTSVSRIEQAILFTSRLVGYLRTHDLSKVYLQQQPDTLSKMLALLSLDSKYISSIKDVQKLGPIINDIYIKYQDLKNTIAKYQPMLSSKPTGHVVDFNTDQFSALNEILSRISDLMLAGAPVLDLMKFNDRPEVAALQRITRQIADFSQGLPVKVNGHNYHVKMTPGKKSVNLVITDDNAPSTPVFSNNIAPDDFKEIDFSGQKYGFHILNFADIGQVAKPLTFILEPAVDSLTAKFDNSAIIQSAENCLQAYFLFRQHKYPDAVNLILPDLNLALRDRFGSDTVALDRINKVLRIAGGVINANSSADIEAVITQN